MEKIIDIIANMGFPIGISIFLLVRVETKMDALTKSIYELTSAIRKAP